MKTIDTLVDDIHKVIQGKGGWNYTVSEYFKETLGDAAERRLASPEQPRQGTLRMSNVGHPCTRKLWYTVNYKGPTEPLEDSTKIKFFFGDMLEGLLLSLAKAAGHDVQGEQTQIVVDGIVGHRDAVIDGVTVDVKSASTASFEKFKKHNLRNEDPFGYIQQLAGYVKGGENDPFVTDKKGGAFLAIDKQFGHICLDYYDLTPELDYYAHHLKNVKSAVAALMPPSRPYSDMEDGKSGNRKIGPPCTYCEYKWECWSGLRGFAYSNGPRFLTKVSRTPDVPEFTT